MIQHTFGPADPARLNRASHEQWQLSPDPAPAATATDTSA